MLKNLKKIKGSKLRKDERKNKMNEDRKRIKGQKIEIVSSIDKDFRNE